uniref:TLDc domain-containing protein n=1 Tax=Caenorhabditis tropicalis TaxID=1561998 RepID=A0A1I7TGQ2_9PELO
MERVASGNKIGMHQDFGFQNEVWIDKDKEIGSEFKSFCPGFAKFADTFSTRIISKTDRFIRIRTNNERKHILLELGTSTFGKLNGTEEFLRMSVISSQQSEIYTSGEWVRELAEVPENVSSSFEDENSDDYFFDSDF